MESALVSGLQGLVLGLTNLGPGHVVMMLVGALLLYLGISKGYEPLLLVPIGFGAILVNIPLAGLMDENGILRFFYNTGVLTEVFPVLIFLGIGAMTDFQPLLENPKIILLGAAGQFGHDSLQVHACCNHVAVVPIAGNELVARLQRHLHPNDDGLPADIKVAKSADETHAVHLPGLLLETADCQHGAISGELLLLAELGDDDLGFRGRSFLGDRHSHSLRKHPAIVTERRWAFLNPNSLNSAAAKAWGCRQGLRKTA